ncbi:MAG: SAM-dependent methyltransferase [Rhodospirillaceae bacterium]|mgnify:CR=1 FL=1|nr:SAM-dependent methyltransferase [Rhodospirillaceae bacterium]|tara:strand:+ start:162229 stop:163461 length:1233 start_codon:yes stop_codon:yes gene_type:complete
MLFASLLRKVIQDGSIRLIDCTGKTNIFGDQSEPVCTVRLHNRALDYTLAFDPALTVPEAYMEGSLTIEDGSLYDFIDVAARNFRRLERTKFHRLMKCFDFAMFGQYNPIKRARRNVAHHYDLSDELYQLFLDHDRQYSCAYFPETDTDLETAQHAKKRHLAAKLGLEEGQSVLDIGCGWGGLALYLSQVENVDITGITLSTKQQKVASERASNAGITDRVRFKLQDYRHEQKVYDRIVSVGMFEHVGKMNYAEFFTNVAKLLSDDGVMVLHSIGRFDTPHAINPFIRKYIFPGADLPALSEVTRAIEPTGLRITDIEILRLHYAETLKLWRERFMEQWDKAAKIYDDRFCRMWEAYFVLCEVGFRHLDLMVFQIQLTKNIDAVPLTRDYMVDWERQQAERENKKRRHAA